MLDKVILMKAGTSVFHNNAIVTNNQHITATPYVFNFWKDEEEEIHIEGESWFGLWVHNRMWLRLK